MQTPNLSGSLPLHKTMQSTAYVQLCTRALERACMTVSPIGQPQGHDTFTMQAAGAVQKTGQLPSVDKGGDKGVGISP